MIMVDKDVMVPMTDGVRLATDVFRLADGPPSPPTLRCRSPMPAVAARRAEIENARVERCTWGYIGVPAGTTPGRRPHDRDR